jgi:hypothetical protein
MLLKTIQDQQQQITEIRNLVLFQTKEKKIDRTEIKRLLQELNEKGKETKQQPFFPTLVLLLGKSLIVVCL